MSATFLLDVVNIGLSYGIVWYEHFGHDNRRTLVRCENIREPILRLLNLQLCITPSLL
jgi:hypothetical protein